MNKCVNILYKDNEEMVKKEMLTRVDDILKFINN